MSIVRAPALGRTGAAAIAVAALGLAFPALAERNFSGSPPANLLKAAAAPETMSAEPAPSRFLALPALSAEAIQVIRTKDASHGAPKALQIGVVRDWPAVADRNSSGPGWRKVAAGEVLQWRVRAVGAQALRLRLDVRKTVPGVRARFASALSPSRVTGMPLDTATPSWSPMIAGEEAIVELFVPLPASPNDVDVSLSQVADHFVNPLEKGFGEKREWLAQPCQRDLICESVSDPVLARAGTASIKITWVYDHAAYACSATLLNPADGSFRPYIYTAAHCLNEQAAADNVISHWFYDKSTCGGDEPRGDSVQVPGGAELLAVDDTLDASFLKLKAMPPAGATFAGWDSDPPSTGEAVTALHHANGEVTKVSHATVLPPPPYPYLSVGWNSGIVQGGSSGSGLFTRSPSVQDMLFRGGLSASQATCNDPGFGLYSRIDRFWPKIAPYLSTAAAHANATGLWWNPAEPGWGLTLEHQGDSVFGALFTYDDDGRPMWLVASDMRKQLDGLFSGALYRMTGSGLAAQRWSPPAASTVGTLQVSLSGANDGELTYSVNGRTARKPISRQQFNGRAPVCTGSTADRARAANYQDLWWNANEPGWGMAIAHQGDVLFVTLFTYDDQGRDVWYVGSDVARKPDGTYTGALYETTRGPANAGVQAAPNARLAGDIRLEFADGQAARVALTLAGRPITKTVTRQVFGDSPPVCH